MLTTLILLGSALQMVPVWDGRRSPPESVKGERCNVAEIRRAQRVKVRSGPGRQYNETDMLGSGLVDHSQTMTVAARATAEKKAMGQRS